MLGQRSETMPASPSTVHWHLLFLLLLARLGDLRHTTHGDDQPFDIGLVRHCRCKLVIAVGFLANSWRSDLLFPRNSLSTFGLDTPGSKTLGRKTYTSSLVALAQMLRLRTERRHVTRKQTRSTGNLKRQFQPSARAHVGNCPLHSR